MASKTLYPPIVETYMPAFVSSEGCKVKFTLSPFNARTEIEHAQVTVVYLETNKNVLKCNNQIKIAEVLPLEDDIYYIELNNIDLNIKDGFEPNTFYKVQIRFSSIPIEDIDWIDPADHSKGPTATWLNNENNLANFSEWSTVCMIKGLKKEPEFIFRTLDAEGHIETTSSTLSIYGKVSFDYHDNEMLDNYRLYLMDKDTDEIFDDSGILYKNDNLVTNEVNYTFKYRLQEGVSYKVLVEYETNNGYRKQEDKLVKAFSYDSTAINGTLKVYMDADNGRMIIQITSEDNFLYPIYIRRNDSDSYFTITEDMCKFDNTNTNTFTWIDYTIEAGKFYHYMAQYLTNNQTGQRGKELENKDEYILANFDDIFIVGEDIQLKIAYNQNISSYKQNIPSAATTTLGSRYPFIAQNGNLDYTSFSVSGIVSAVADENNIFFSEEEAYGQAKDLYKNYNINNYITRANDYIYEKRFREKAMRFLQAPQFRLYRSLTEGNKIVKITDLSLSPNQQLGRRIWTFQASISEVDDNTIENYEKYKIKNFEYSESMDAEIPIIKGYDSFMIHTDDEPQTTIKDSRWKE